MSSPNLNEVKFEVHGNRVTIKVVRRDSWGSVVERKQVTVSKFTFLKALDSAEFTVKWKDLVQ